MIEHEGVRYFAADTHAHIYPGKIAEKATAAVGDFYDTKMKLVGLPHVLMQRGAAAGIDRFVVCSVATKVEQVRSINEFIARKCREYPAFLGLGAWHQDIEDVDGELADIKARGLRGVKLHPDFQRVPIDDPRLMPLYEKAGRLGLIILFHMGDYRGDLSSPRRLMRVLEKVPDLTCIAAHLGGYTDWDAALKELHGTNVYVDTSSSLFALSPSRALESIAHFGVEKTLFGTDFPMWEPGEELRRFFALGLSPAENRAILYGNFSRLFAVGDPA